MLSVSPESTVYVLPLVATDGIDGAAGADGAATGALEVAALDVAVDEAADGAVEVVDDGAVEVVAAGADAPSVPLRPSRDEHAGQAPQPCDASTRFATAICSDLLADAGVPVPPLAAQVLWENWRPPE